MGVRVERGLGRVHRAGKGLAARLAAAIRQRGARVLESSGQLGARFLRLPVRGESYRPLSPEIVQEYNRLRPGGPRRLLCYVPFQNMSFWFDGKVLACNYNRRAVLGTYPERTIREMWFGTEGRTLRRHMEHDDLSYGCDHCRTFFENGCYSALKGQAFDKYAKDRRGGFPQVMEFELSNLCNLQCVMCSGRTSSSIRTQREKLPPLPERYDEAFVEQLLPFLPHLKEAKFYGGEPFLSPLYYRIWDAILEVNPRIEIFVITNGTVMNDRIRKLLSRGRVLVGVSLDAVSKERYEAIRVGADYEEVMKNLRVFDAACRERGEAMIVSTTPMRLNWDEVPEVVRFCNRFGAAVYISYLKKPAHLALWNLDADCLDRIADQLAAHDMPDGTETERRNRTGYLDFVRQVRLWAAQNRTQDSAPRPSGRMDDGMRNEEKEGSPCCGN